MTPNEKKQNEIDKKLCNQTGRTIVILIVDVAC